MTTAVTFPEPSMPAKARDTARVSDPSRAPFSQSRSSCEWVRPQLCPPGALDGTRYTMIRLLGQGGMGEVYEAEHQDLGRRCVVKVLHKNHRHRQDLAIRMRDEARTLGGLHHPNLIDVFDLGTTGDGRPFFVMDLLVGRDLRSELVRLGVIAVPAALDLICQALDGLGAAHEAGIVHRDVKLENLFLCDDGKVKVIDFGIAKLVNADASVTRCGVAIGTPRTMAPEQCRVSKVDARTDLYAAGLALYELVTGRGPFDDLHTNEHAICFAHCERTPPPPSYFAPQPIDPGVEAAILKAIAKSPEDRFQTAAEMAGALRSLRRDLQAQRRRAASSPAAWTGSQLVSPAGYSPWPAAAPVPSPSWQAGLPPPPKRKTHSLSRTGVSRSVAIAPSLAAFVLSVAVVGLSVALASLARPQAATGSPASSCTAK